MSLGDTLRAAREKAGLSVDDIMHVTKMTRDQVSGLETADYHAFSAPVYTKGFIKQYARVVGLDPAPLVAAYLANPNGTEKNDPSREMPVVALETISSESGALVSVRPPVPHAAPAPAPAPVAKKVVAPAPSANEASLFDLEAPAAPAPASAPTFTPHPEKRLAPVEPGVVPPEPPSKLVRFDDPAPKPAPAPVAKNEPEPTAIGAVAATPYWNEVAPPVAPKPVSVPAAPFVFPGPATFLRPEPAPAPVSAPAPAPAPAKIVSAAPDPRIAAAPHPVVSSAAQPAFVEDDLFATPERTPGPAPVPPQAPAPTLFPEDDRDLKAGPDAPNPVRIFFANCRGAVAKAFAATVAAASSAWARVRAGLKSRRARPALLGVAGVVVLAAFVGLIASLFSGGGEPPAGPDAPVNEAFFPPEPDPLANGPVEIRPILPAPRSFAK